MTTGERSSPEPRQLAQDVGTHLGKVLRIDPMGGAAEGIRDRGRPARDLVLWPPQSAIGGAGPDGELWTVEHGPEGGDELNHPSPA